MGSDVPVDVSLRDCLAATAIVFAPQTEVPRERALIQSAVASLATAFSERIFTKTRAIDEISKHGTLPELRSDVAATLLDKLRTLGYVVAEEGDKYKYHLSRDLLRESTERQASVDKLVESVVDKLFSDLSLTAPIRTLLRERLLLCLAKIMSRFGRQHAFQIAGKADGPVSLERRDVVAVCNDTLRDRALPLTAERLADAIAELFAGRDPAFARFVFSLAQHYYYLRLLGLTGGLDVLNEGVFNGAEFFIDTNLVIPFVFEESRHRRSVLELSELCLRFNITLHTTECGLEELNRVFTARRSDVIKAIELVPDEILTSTRNVFLRAYLAEAEKKPGLKPEEFFSRFADLRDYLKNNWAIEVLDAPVESSHSTPEVNRVKQILQNSSRNVRNIPKGQNALDHDAHVYLLIVAERQQRGDKSAWLITLDSSLPDAALNLDTPHKIPFCMTLDGFLQIMSPYVRADHQQSFAEMFVDVISRHLFRPEEVIDLDDLRMFTEIDLSVRKLPSQDVRTIVRNVKHSMGAQPTTGNKSQLAYEVHKALSDPELLFKTQHEEELKAMKLELDSKQRILEEKEAQAESERKKYSAELEGLRTEFEKRDAERAADILELQRKAEQAARERDDEKQARKGADARATGVARQMQYIVATFGALAALFAIPHYVPLFAQAQYPWLLAYSIAAAAAAAWIAAVFREKITAIIAIACSVFAAIVGIARLL